MVKKEKRKWVQSPEQEAHFDVVAQIQRARREGFMESATLVNAVWITTAKWLDRKTPPTLKEIEEFKIVFTKMWEEANSKNKERNPGTRGYELGI